MKPKVTGEFIRQSAMQLQHFDISAARAAEIAHDIDRVNNAALAAEAEGDFNDEPSRFTLVLAQLRSAKPRR